MIFYKLNSLVYNFKWLAFGDTFTTKQYFMVPMQSLCLALEQIYKPKRLLIGMSRRFGRRL